MARMALAGQQQRHQQQYVLSQQESSGDTSEHISLSIQTMNLLIMQFHHSLSQESASQSSLV